MSTNSQLQNLVNQRRLKVAQELAALQETVNQSKITITNTALPEELQDDSKNRLNKLLVEKAFNLVKSNTPAINQLLIYFNLPNLQDLETTLATKGQQEVEKMLLNVACPNKEILVDVLTTRNLIADQVDKFTNYFDSVDTTLNVAINILNTQTTTVEFLRLFKLATSQGIKVLPAAPGLATAILSDIESLLNIITFSATGNPKLEKTKAIVLLAQMYFQQAAQIVKSLLNRFQILDLLLVKCGETPASVNPRIIQLANLYKQPAGQFDEAENYQGFTLLIETEPIQGELVRKRAVALNNNGIPVLQTAYSFTTKPQLLYEQLKFTIDSQNLKAN